MGTSSGAKKAWETIRSKKFLKTLIRHMAAVKANETRGEKGRHNAALKAWKTRREKLQNKF